MPEAVHGLTDAQFITALIAIASAMIAWVTLGTSARKFRAERALPVLRHEQGSAGPVLKLVNVGGRAALHVEIASEHHWMEVAGAAAGESIELSGLTLPTATEVTVSYVDADYRRRVLTHAVTSSAVSRDGTERSRSHRPGRFRLLLCRLGFSEMQ